MALTLLRVRGVPTLVLVIFVEIWEGFDVWVYVIEVNITGFIGILLISISYEPF